MSVWCFSKAFKVKILLILNSWDIIKNIKCNGEDPAEHPLILPPWWLLSENHPPPAPRFLTYSLPGVFIPSFPWPTSIWHLSSHSIEATAAVSPVSPKHQFQWIFRRSSYLTSVALNPITPSNSLGFQECASPGSPVFLPSPGSSSTLCSSESWSRWILFPWVDPLRLSFLPWTELSPTDWW